MFTAEQVTQMMGNNGYSRITETSGSLWGHWGLALLILIVIALFYGVNSRNRKEDERRLADNLYSLNGRMGIVEKGVSDNQILTMRNDNVLTALSQDYSFRIGGLTCQTNNNTSAIDQLGTRKCNIGAYQSACGSGLPEFVRKQTFVQDGDAEIIQRSACGNAFA